MKTQHVKGWHAGACFVLALSLAHCGVVVSPPKDSGNEGGATPLPDSSDLRSDAIWLPLDASMLGDVPVFFDTIPPRPDAFIYPDVGAAPDVVSARPDVVVAPPDAGPVDPSAATSRVELIVYKSMDSGAPVDALTSLRAMFAVGPNRSFDRAMTPASNCTNRQVENCTVSHCFEPLPRSGIASGTLTVDDGRLHIAMSPNSAGDYPQSGANDPPWNRTGTTLIAATGSAAIPAWAVAINTPGFAVFTAPPPATLRRSQPIVFSMGPQDRAVGRRAVLIQTSASVTMYCTFEAGAEARVSATALSNLPAGDARITPSAVSEVLVNAGSERILVSEVITTGTPNVTIIN